MIQYLHPTLTAVGANWLNGLQLETKLIAKLREAPDAYPQNPGLTVSASRSCAMLTLRCSGSKLSALRT